MLPSRNLLFSARQADLRRVAANLQRRGTLALTGPEGVGKSQLAVEFGHRYGRYFTGGVFWISFTIPEEVSAQVAACGGAGGLGLRADFSDLSLDDQLHLVLKAWQQPTPRLLIYDDCDDEELLREWLPATGGSHVLVTSRRPSWDGGVNITAMAVGNLSREEGAFLLRGLRPDLAEGAPALRELAQDLEGLPLALRIAGGFLRLYRERISVEALLEQARSREVLELAATLAGEGEQAPPARGRLGRRRQFGSAPTYRAYAMADRWLEHGDLAGRPARALLSRAGWFAPGEPFPRQVLLDSGSGARSATALGRLIDLGLLEPDGEQLLRVHRGLSDLIRSSAGEPAAVFSAEDTVVAWARAANDAGDSDGRLLALPHLDLLARSAVTRGEDGRAAALCFELGRVLWAAGDLRRARANLERALAIRERILGPADEGTIRSLSTLGSLLQAQGDLAGAQEALSRALGLAEPTLGAGHAETAQILASLAWTLRYQGDLAGARAHLERSVAASQTALGSDHPDTVGRMDGLGMLLREQGDLEAALHHCRQAMDVLVRTAGPDDPRTLAAINNVGLLLREKGDLVNARAYIEHALTVSEDTLGPDHPDTATALDNMGTLLQAEGDLTSARDHIERALAIRERTLGAENPATGTSYNNLGMLLRDQGDLEGARPHLEQALIVSQRVLGPYDPQTATSYSNVGTLLLKLGDLFGAQPHLERALSIREQNLGPEHAATATSLADLAALHLAYGDMVGARTYLERALEIREEALGPDHPLTASCSHELGLLLRQEGALDAARQHFRRAVSVRERELGPDHPDTLASMSAMDELDRELGGGRRAAWPRPIEEISYFEE
jgi:tetratricopeptide (TPR) repeat protein